MHGVIGTERYAALRTTEPRYEGPTQQQQCSYGPTDPREQLKQAQQQQQQPQI